VTLTLAGHADWLVARLADAVAEGGAARLRGVPRVGARQAGAQASRCALWFIGARWTHWWEERKKTRHLQTIVWMEKIG